MDLSDADIARANAAGRELLETAARAVSARYVPDTGLVVLDLTNGCIFGFPAQLVQDLHGAMPDDLAEIEVEGKGLSLHWPRLDADLYVPALVAGVFGTRQWMARDMGSRGGNARSAAKAAASRANGAKGGRPRKAAG